MGGMTGEEEPSVGQQNDECEVVSSSDLRGVGHTWETGMKSFVDCRYWGCIIGPVENHTKRMGHKMKDLGAKQNCNHNTSTI